MVGKLATVDGLISGLNTSDIIAKLMSVEQAPLLALQDTKNKNEDRLSALQDVNTKLASLQQAAKKLATLGTINVKTAVTNANTYSAIQPLIASASVGAASGTFDVKIQRLATNTSTKSTAAVGQAINAGVALASAGFGIPPTLGTFTINGATITIDKDTILSDGVDAAGANTIIAKINNAGAGVTASLVNDSDGRANLIQLTSTSALRLGAGADTSNFLTVAKLAAAPVVGNTAATVTSAAVGAGPVGSTTITINGVTTVTSATGPGNSAADNAASIANDINNTKDSTVIATGNADGTITLAQKTAGSGSTINITDAGTGTGLVAGVTSNGSDKVASTSNLGVVATSEKLTGARLATALTATTGSFKINGVEIAYDATKDSLNQVISRINASSANVTAAYDAMQDKIVLTNGKTGGSSISLEDVTGNLLAATGVLSATQTMGQTAAYTVSTVNGGAVMYSETNTISGVVPGVTLSLKAATTDPITVTVSQDENTAVSAVKGYIDAYNQVASTISKYSAYDMKAKQGGPLTGDSTVTSIVTTIRSMMSDQATGVTGSYKSFADLGLNFGAIGSTVGTTDTLQLDDAKFRTALQTNPAAVEAVFAAFQSQATLNPGGTGSIASISGVPSLHHMAGTYTITSQATGGLSATFTPLHGAAGPGVMGSITAGGNNGTLIVGLNLTAKGMLADGVDTIDVSVQSRGIAYGITDYLDSLTKSGGMFAQRTDDINSQIRDLDTRMTNMQTQLDAKQTSLQQRFTAMEVALSKLQTQSNGLLSALGTTG